MAANSDESVQQVQDACQHLRADVIGPDARAQTAYTVERTLFRRLLALGAVAAVLCHACRCAAGGAGYHP